VTVGPQWKPTESIIFAPEVRYDHGTGNPGPFENGRKDLFVGTVNLIVRW
jgi:hypothetical protein